MYKCVFECYLSGVFAKLKSNSIVQAEPSELHFSGFEVGKDYRKILVGLFFFFYFVHILAKTE